jgi:diguanylate cyclase (GGDEF)-like protein
MTPLEMSLLVLFALILVVLLLSNHRHRLDRDQHAAREAELRIVQQGIIEAIQVFGPDGVLISRNPAADAIFEMESHELSKEALRAKWTFIGEDRTPLAPEERPLGIAMRTGLAAERATVGIQRNSDSSIRWLSMSTFPILGTRSQVYGYVSCAWDVTERTHTNRELEVLSHASEQLIATLVPADVVHTLITAAAELCSAPGEPLRRAMLFLVDGQTLVVTAEHDPVSPVPESGGTLPLAEHPYIQQVLASRQALVAELRPEDCGPVVAESIARHQLMNCAWVPMTRNGEIFAILSVAGRHHGLISGPQLQRLKTLAAMGELALNNAEAHVRVAEMARTDPLTGVGNRRALDERLRQLTRSGFALVAIDVDHLKRINDAHGHHAGDELITTLATALAAELRPSDMLARIGGDEFIALLVDCDATGAVELGKRLQAAATRVPLRWGPVSISVGSAAGAAGDAPDGVARAADVALYRAKQSRRTPVAPAHFAVPAP